MVTIIQHASTSVLACLTSSTGFKYFNPAWVEYSLQLKQGCTQPFIISYPLSDTSEIQLNARKITCHTPIRKSAFFFKQNNNFYCLEK